LYAAVEVVEASGQFMVGCSTDCSLTSLPKSSSIIETQHRAAPLHSLARRLRTGLRAWLHSLAHWAPSSAGLIGYAAEYIQKGENNWEHEAFYRGIFPRSGSPDSLIPLGWFDDFQFLGTLVFNPSTTVRVGSADLAFKRDDAIFWEGTYGEAVGFTPAGGQYVKFEDPRWAVQLGSWRTLKAKHTEAMYTEIKGLIEQLGISYEWCGIDATGLGQGTADLFIHRGYRVKAINWGSGATDKPVLEEDTLKASDRFAGIASEMYHVVFRYWLEAGHVKGFPHMDKDRLYRELSKRRYKLTHSVGESGSQLVALEDKDEFKKHNLGKSPDCADSAVQLLHVARQNGKEVARLTRQRRLKLPPPPSDTDVANLEPIDFST
jgi:hypothetical protein